MIKVIFLSFREGSMNPGHQPIPFQKGHTLAFRCTRCKGDIAFSIFDMEKEEGILTCPGCKQQYLFNDPTLMRQLRLFEALCRQIKDSEEILGNTSVGVDVGSHNVQIPFKLLLTRFNSRLKLQLGNETIEIAFRIEPQQIPEK